LGSLRLSSLLPFTGGGGSEVRREGRGRGASSSSLMVLWDVDANSLSCDDISIGE